jgi:uncharacterized protein
MKHYQALVAAIYRYPVKSMRGESLDSAELRSRGLAGDREWAITFPDGRVGSGKTWQHLRRIDGLLNYTATSGGGRVEVRLPDAEILAASNPRLDTILSEYAGDHVRLARENRISHFDVAGLHIISGSSIAALAERVPQPMNVTVDRFRPNILLGQEVRPRLESAWAGHQILIGSQAVLEITEHTERCAMVTLGQVGVAPDKSLLKVLAAEFNTCLGVYARVVQPGVVYVGDAVSLLHR